MGFDNSCFRFIDKNEAAGAADAARGLNHEGHGVR
jgi:hypothetical protein